MLVEERIYTLHAGQGRKFLSIYSEHGLHVQRRYLRVMLGYYLTEAGPLNQVVHIWGHESFEERLENREAMKADPRFQTYWEEVRGLIIRQETKLMVPATFFEPVLEKFSAVTSGAGDLCGFASEGTSLA
jgi:hypothetical protein